MDKKAVLLGLFDGLHLGHRRAISELSRYDGKKTVYTFDTLSLDTKGKRGILISDPQKREGLLKLGADEVISDRFETVRDLTSEEFVSLVISDRLKADAVFCGENFSFAKGGSAGPDELLRLLKPRGIPLITVPVLYDGGKPISTSRIRALIESGDIKEANRLLGYNYGYSGEVAHGFKIGTRMGIKTLNIPFDTSFAMPKKGVYATRVTIPGGVYKGVTNIGTRPTVHEADETVIETHILGFDGDIYGCRARVELLEFLRPERKFSDINELKMTVERDISYVRDTVTV